MSDVVAFVFLIEVVDNDLNWYVYGYAVIFGVGLSFFVKIVQQCWIQVVDVNGIMVSLAGIGYRLNYLLYKVFFYIFKGKLGFGRSSF